MLGNMGKTKRNDNNPKQTKLSGWVLQPSSSNSVHTQNDTAVPESSESSNNHVTIIDETGRSLILAPLINEQMAYKVS